MTLVTILLGVSGRGETTPPWYESLVEEPTWYGSSAPGLKNWTKVLLTEAAETGAVCLDGEQ